MTQLTKHQMSVFLDRYALKQEGNLPADTSLRGYIDMALSTWEWDDTVSDPNGVFVETRPGQMWSRVASAISGSLNEFDDFLDLLYDFRFVPGGRILSGAGTDSEVTFYNCFVIPIETKARREWRGQPEDRTPAGSGDRGCDSREAIVDTMGVMVDILSRGGGVGINWSVLRPKDSYLKRINGRSSGPVTWMDTASHMVGGVEQGGTRRGAAMFMLDDWHPDLLEFIEAKQNLDKITHANVSVAISDRFMQAVKDDTDWWFEFPDTSDSEYDRLWTGDLEAWKAAGRTTIPSHSLSARWIWRRIAESAWDNGEPGIVFLERYNAKSTARSVERIIGVNPCGEQGLGAYSVCNLGAMNLAAYVLDGNFEWGDLTEDIKTAVRFLDDVIDKTFYFIPENERIQKDLRRIGLGVMGLADALAYLGLRYGSIEAQRFTENVFDTMKHVALSASADLAREKGPAPAWRAAMLGRPYFDDLTDEEEDYIRERGLRNVFVLTQAPTGTTSLLAGVNSGIEPFFRLEYERRDATGTHTVRVTPYAEWQEENSCWAMVPDYFVTADRITVYEHIAMQAAAQSSIDSSVSKTINAPNSHTVEDVEKAYMLAYDEGLKGIAYFRDGCGRTQILNAVPDEVEVVAPPPEEQVEPTVEDDDEYDPPSDVRMYSSYADEPESYKRPTVMAGTTRKVQTGAGAAYITVNVDDDGRPREVFLSVGKAGSDITEMGEALGRLISLAIQNGSHVADVANQLVGIGGFSKFSKSLPHAVGEALSEYRSAARTDWGMGSFDLTPEPGKSSPLFTYTPHGREKVSLTVTGTMCPECRTYSVVHTDGCEKCLSCEWSRC